MASNGFVSGLGTGFVIDGSALAGWKRVTETERVKENKIGS